MECVQENKANPCNNSRDSQQQFSINDGEGSQSANENQSEPILLEAEVHEGVFTLAQQSSSTLQGTCYDYILFYI